MTFVDGVSLTLSFLSLLLTFIFNGLTLKNYKKSIQPVLKCSFFKNKNRLFLSIKNIGKLEALDASISDIMLSPILESISYKDNNIFSSNSFNLLPEEEVVNEVGSFYENVTVNLNTVNPTLSFVLKYRPAKKGANVKESRKELLLSNYVVPELSVSTDLSGYKIEDKLRSIGNATTRVANYFDGNLIYDFDEINAPPSSTFQKDIENLKCDKKGK